MLKIIKIISFGFIFYMNTCTSQNLSLDIKNTNESILFFKHKPFDIYLFNKKLNKELKTTCLFIYNLEDIIGGSFVINAKYFKKPLSKFAIESYSHENIFFKSLIPKPISYQDFKYLKR